MKTFLISPPFGNYINHSNCTRVMGSYTLERRWGLIWNTLKSLRRTEHGWVNRIGLRNCGLRNLGSKLNSDRIWSLVGLEEDDWEEMFELLLWAPWPLTVELNLGCPNVHKYGISPTVLNMFTDQFTVVAKLSPVGATLETAQMCVDAGVEYLHLSNTLPTARGGESGGRLREINLPLVADIAARYPTVNIIAGGGIYLPEHIEQYRQAGATRFSLSTAWFKPWRARSLTKI